MYKLRRAYLTELYILLLYVPFLLRADCYSLSLEYSLLKDLHCYQLFAALPINVDIIEIMSISKYNVTFIYVIILYHTKIVYARARARVDSVLLNPYVCRRINRVS